jgi:O-antigen/teichoic acid export membrane protein
MNKETLNRLISYGAPATGSGWLYKFYDNADYLVVGKLLGPIELGLYTVAFRLAMLANERVSAVVNRVAFPAFAKEKDDLNVVVEHWFTVTRRVTLITFPMLAWLAMSASDFVPLILGAKWQEAVLPLRFLCVMTAIKILTNVVGQLLQAVGFPKTVLRYDIITAIVLPLAFVLGCKYGGLWGMGVAWCTVFPLLRFSFLLGARKLLPFRLTDYARNLKDTALLTLLGTAGMAVVLAFMAPGWARFLLQSAVWAGVTGSLIFSNGSVRESVLTTLRQRGAD